MNILDKESRLVRLRGMMRLTLVLLLLASVCVAPCLAATESKAPAWQSWLNVTVSMEDTAVKDKAFPIAVTLMNVSKDETSHYLRVKRSGKQDILPYSIEFVRMKTKEVTATRKPSESVFLANTDTSSPSVRSGSPLQPGKKIEFQIDAAFYMRELIPGSYSLTVFVWTLAGAPVASETAEIEIRWPKHVSPEAAALAKVAADDIVKSGAHVDKALRACDVAFDLGDADILVSGLANSDYSVKARALRNIRALDLPDLPIRLAGILKSSDFFAKERSLAGRTSQYRFHKDLASLIQTIVGHSVSAGPLAKVRTRTELAKELKAIALQGGVGQD